MIKNIKKVFNITTALVIGSLTLLNCESDADKLGSQFFQNGAQGTETSYPVIAYNVYNHDSLRIRTDGLQADSVTLGAFSESQFGMQKSGYVTQVRLSSYAPDFGTNPVLDSAVMVIKPSYRADSVTTTTNENYTYPDGAVAAKKVVNTYPIKKYGKTKINGKTVFNIKVNEVNDFLFSKAEKIYSNKNVATGTLLGSKVFNGSISSVKITKNADNSALYENQAAIRIPLDSAFFQNKIIKKGASSDLADAASFIRYFKGMKISVVENDGYIFKFNPNDVTVNLYYKNDKVTNGVTTREKNTFPLDLSSNNVHFNHITFDYAGTPVGNALSNVNQITGDAKLFAQGMGGPGIGFRVSESTLSIIKDLYKKDKIGIMTAKIRIYTDASWNNNYQKPQSFVVRFRDLTPPAGKSEYYLQDFLIDITTLANSGNYSLIRINKDPSYYEVGITQTFKDIIEKEAKNNDIVINVGSYSLNATGAAIGSQYPSLGAQNFNNRHYTPNRIVFVGSDPLNEKNRAKLILTYGKK